jgi:non-specific serine/threonine protein kinase
LAGALGEFWQRRGHFQEGREWLERAIEASGSVPGRACAVAKHAAGRLAYFQHDYMAARALLTASLAQYHNLDDRRGMAECLSALGSSELATGKLGRAERLLDKSVTLFRGLGDSRGVAASLYSLGNLMATRGDFERAAILFEASRAAARAIGDEWLTTYAVHALGHLAWTRGDIEPAVAHLREAVARSVELGDRRALAVCFESLALVAASQQQAERAARLFGAAAELRASVGAHRRRWLEPTYQEGVARTRTALGERLFEAAWATGRDCSGADAVAQALAPEDPTP